MLYKFIIHHSFKMELKFKLISFLFIFCISKAFAQPPYCGEPAIISSCGVIEARGGVSPNRGCDSVVATFTNSSTGVIDSTYYCWGDGQTAAFAGVVSATHIFRKGTFCDTTYKVRMTVIKNCPLGKTVTSILTYVTVQRTPTVAFWANLVDAEANTQITFTNGSSTALVLGNGTPCQTASCFWDFGDGDTLTVPCAPFQNHIYRVAGQYEVSLAVIHECATITVPLRNPSNPGRLNIYYRPVIDIKIDSIVCANTSVTMRNNSKYVKKYQWNVVSTPFGGNVSFSDSLSSRADTLPSPKLTFSIEGTYTIRTTLTSFYGATFTWVKTILVKIPPQVTLTRVADACDSLTVTPRNLVTYRGGAPESYQWSFSNQTPSTSTIAYPSPLIYAHGDYNISAKVTNYCGIAMDSLSFRVSPPPIARFIATLDTVCVPAKVSIHSIIQNVRDFNWTVYPNINTVFVDNTQYNSVDPVIQLSRAGSYRIKGTYIGCRNLDKDTVITVITKPTARLTPIPDNCGRVTLSPSLNTTNGNAYSWIFEGGMPTTSTSPNPTNIVFSNSGINRILVAVSNQCGTTTDSTPFHLREVVPAQCPNDTVVCNTSSAMQLTGLPSGGSWTGNRVTNGTYYPSSSMIGTDTLIYTVGELQCRTRDTMWIRSSGTRVNAGANVSLCRNDNPTLLLGNTPIGGQWSGLGISPTGVFDPNVGIGTYPIRYTLTNSDNCSNESIRIVTIKPAPVAAFAPVDVQCMGRTVRFTNWSSNFSSLRWDFGGQGSSFVPNPSFVFNTAGQYRVKLTATHANQCTADTTQIVSVMQRGHAAFSPNADTIRGCGPLVKVKFENLSVGDSLSYLWDFDNTRQDITQNVLDTILFHQSNGIRVYKVRLMATNLCGTDTAIHYVRVEPKPTALFTLIPRNDCSPMEVEFLHVSSGYPTSFWWNLGNGRTSTDSTIGRQMYASESDSVGKRYEIKLIVGNSCGIDSVTQVLNVAPPHVRAFFQIDTMIGCAPLTIHCTNYSTPQSLPRWKVSKNGQEIVATTRNFDQTFMDAGNYTIILYARNPNGCGYDSTTRSIQVLTGRAPNIEVLPAICAMDTLKVRTTDSISTVQSIRWTFGDSNAPPSSIPTHCYERAGRYLVTLHGNSVYGNCPLTQTAYVNVRALPTAAFVPDKTEGCPPLNIQFTNTSRVGTGQTLYWAWDLGNRNVSNTQNPIQRYDSTGRYTIQLRVTDNYGCSDDTVFHPIIVYPKPTAHFTIPNHKICGLPINVTFSNQTVGATNYNWDFGDISNSFLTEPTHPYNVEGQRIVKLTASNAYLCTDVFKDTIQLFKKPTVAGNITPEWGCSPLRVHFQNQSQNTSGKWFWRYGDGAMDTISTHLYTHAGKYSPTLVVSNGDFCLDSVKWSDRIEVLAKPVADFEWKDSVSRIGEKPNGILSFHNLSQWGKDFKWQFGDGGLSTLENPMHRYLQAKPYFVTLTTTALNGCVDSVQKEVTPKFFSGLFVPNVMSIGASTEGMKYFLPKGTMLKTYQLSIYSTYGKLLWFSDKLEQGQPVDFWDGSLNGEPLPQDVYVWKIQATFEDGSVWRGMCDGSGRCSNVGTITILR